MPSLSQFNSIFFPCTTVIRTLKNSLTPSSSRQRLCHKTLGKDGEKSGKKVRMSQGMRELRDLQLELLSRETGKQQRFGNEHRSQKLDHNT